MRNLLIFIALFSCIHLVQAQQRIVKELAEPFTIEVAITGNASIPVKGNTYGAFEVLDVQTGSKDVQVKTTQLSLQLIAYDTGTFKLSEIITGADVSKDIMISISSPPENLVKEYAPVKEIDITFEEPANYKNYVWLLLALAGTAIALYLLVRKRKAKPEIAAIIPDEHWQDKLFRITDGWKKESLNSVELGEGLISVLHGRFNVPQKRSVRKLLKSIQKQTTGVHGYALKDILVQTDAWRFGKQQAEKLTGDKAIETIKKIVETKDGT